MKINTILFTLVTLNMVNTHTMDNPPQDELSHELYKKIEKALYSNASVNELNKLIADESVYRNLSFEQKKDLLSKSRKYLTFLEKKIKKPSCSEDCCCHTTIAVTFFGIMVLALASKICSYDDYGTRRTRQYESKIYSCKSQCKSMLDSRFMDCRRVPITKWLSPDTYDLWEHLGSPKKDNLSYNNKCKKIIDLMYSFCTNSCSSLIKPAPACSKSFYCDDSNKENTFMYALLIPIGAALGFIFLYIFVNHYTVKFIGNKKSKMSKKITLLEKMFYNDQCCICLEHNTLNGNIPCELHHPNEGICIGCLRELKNCPLCRKKF